MRPSRFEKRILIAMAVVALGSVAGSIAFGYAALRDAYRTGVNPHVVQALEGGVGARRAHLVALRELGERTLASLTRDRTVFDALERDDIPALTTRLDEVFAACPDVERIAFVRGEEDVLVERSRPETEPMHRLERSGVVNGVSGVTVEVVIATPEATFERFEEAGELTEIMRRLDREEQFVSKAYLYVYIAFVCVISFAALVLGAYLSKRVTRRFGVLVEANRRLGSGDLTVDIPVTSDDEIGELTRSFNAMVRDLRDTRERVEYLQRIGAWQEFARRLAHEIKNPLTPIQLASQEIHRSYRGDDGAYRKKLEDATAIIEEEVSTLRRLVGEFSSFARLPTAHLEPSDLRDFLADLERSLPGLVEDVQPEDGAEVRVTITLPESVPVSIDAMMLRRCLDNLIRNAVQATAPVHLDDGKGRVNVRVSTRGPELAIVVEDNGPGVPEADRQSVFDPYFTTKSEGTGLGLAIVKKVALEHGGDIRVDASPLGGASFRLLLPKLTKARAE